MFKKIGLIATSNIEAIKTTLDELVNYFDSRDYEIILDKFCAELTDKCHFQITDANELGNYCDLVIAIGGDGTMLKASHALQCAATRCKPRSCGFSSRYTYRKYLKKYG